MSKDLMSMFNELDDATIEKKTREKVLRAPFSYPGGKTKSLLQILPHLPYRGSYIEPFGGAATVLLSRQSSLLEVFNDRYGGVVALYRCIRNENKCRALVTRLETIVCAREEFVWCKANWETAKDDVERAARWYYMIMNSFGSLGRNFGRSTSGRQQASKLGSHLKDFDRLHQRLRNVLIENQDYGMILRDFDNPNAVFYLDPPYYGVSPGMYKYEMTTDEHRQMLNTVMKMEAYVAISGYHNELYDSYKWDEKHEWLSPVSIRPMAFHEENNKAVGEANQRDSALEVLYIKH